MQRVSVIIPAYNAAKTLGRTVVSLFAQTRKDLEIIVVDDGSTDATPEICRDLQRISPVPMKVFRQKNKRQSAARNAGIDMAEGDYVIFLDADDIAEKKFVEKMAEAAESDPLVDIVCCSFDLLHGDGTSSPRSVGSRGNNMSTGEEALLRVMREELEVWTGSALYRLSMLKDFQVYFDESVTMGQDIEFRWRAFYHARKVALVPELLVHYVQHELSVTRSFDPVRFPPSTWFDPSSFLKYLEERGESGKTLLSSLQNEIIPRFTLRRMRNYILWGIEDFFWHSLKQEQTRQELQRGAGVFLRNPGVALKCFLLLYMPGRFYQRYRSQRAALKRG